MIGNPNHSSLPLLGLFLLLADHGFPKKETALILAGWTTFIPSPTISHSWSFERASQHPLVRRNDNFDNHRLSSAISFPLTAGQSGEE